MKYVILLISLLAVETSRLSAQDTSPPHQQTTLPRNARFELVQSHLAARWTFRLDRFSGRVAQLVKTAADDYTWEDTEVLGLPVILEPSKPRFQIFTSGLAARHTFLFDTESGKTWVLVTGKRKRPDGTSYELNVWQPFAD